MTIRVRFAPSPTGQVHIGNIRTAIFNWLFARHQQDGRFLLRIEDTDRERSTPDAIATLLDCMDWLGLDYDEDAFYQSSRAEEHLAAAEKLISEKKAYRPAPDGPVYFRIPWHTDDNPAVRNVGKIEIPLHPDIPVSINHTGIAYAQLSKKGKAVEAQASLAGFHGLELLIDNKTVFSLDEHIDEILQENRCCNFENCTAMRFQRREIFYHDLIKGELAKPIDTMKDMVIIRSDGSPVFHLANVCDDAAQKISHIIRGDDHVENTYRHIFLFQALGYPAPQYAHLPMITNQQGKPYSKRDGDAFVGDFREKGYLPDALFNYLTLLGWSPGDEREKMSREELVKAFSLDRVISSPAQFDTAKLNNLNALYISELPFAKFADLAWEEAHRQAWQEKLSRELFDRVAEVHQSRIKVMPDIIAWKHFFPEIPPEYNEKALRKAIHNKDGVIGILAELADAFANLDKFSGENIEKAIRRIEHQAGLEEGKLNQAVRVAISGTNVGAELIQTAELLGRSKCVARLRQIP